MTIRRYDTRLIEALARGETSSQAAKYAGISQRTVFRRLRDHRFQKTVTEARDLILNESMGLLIQSVRGAVETLAILLSEKHPPTVRLGAARALLEHATGWQLQEVYIRRLEALEESHKKLKGKGYNVEQSKA